jgi:hypothetical protein
MRMNEASAIAGTHMIGAPCVSSILTKSRTHRNCKEKSVPQGEGRPCCFGGKPATPSKKTNSRRKRAFEEVGGITGEEKTRRDEDTGAASNDTLVESNALVPSNSVHLPISAKRLNGQRKAALKNATSFRTLECTLFIPINSRSIFETRFIITDP